MNKKFFKQAIAAVLSLVITSGVMPFGQLSDIFPSPVWASGEWADGDGTAGHPYLISDSSDWGTLASNVLGGKSYEETYFALNGDFSADVMIGTPDKAFCGIIDGDGHIVTADISDTSNNYTTLFCNIGGADTSGIVIKDCVYSGQLVGGSTAKGAIIAYGNSETSVLVNNCLYIPHSRQDTNNLCIAHGYVGKTRCYSFISLSDATTVYSTAPENTIYTSSNVNNHNFYVGSYVLGIKDLYYYTNTPIKLITSVYTNDDVYNIDCNVIIKNSSGKGVFIAHINGPDIPTSVKSSLYLMQDGQDKSSLDLVLPVKTNYLVTDTYKTTDAGSYGVFCHLEQPQDGFYKKHTACGTDIYVDVNVSGIGSQYYYGGTPLPRIPQTATAIRAYFSS